MKLIITVNVPANASPGLVFKELQAAAYARQGITITSATGHTYSVDMVDVEEAP